MSGAARTAAWQRAGDLGRVAMVGGVIGRSLRHRNYGDAARNLFAVLSAAASSKLLKKAFPKRRPNGEDEESFPSQHAAEVFAAATAVAAQASASRCALHYAVASSVAASRRPAMKHYAVDIVAGAAIGLIGGWVMQRLALPRARLRPEAEVAVQ